MPCLSAPICIRTMTHFTASRFQTSVCQYRPGVMPALVSAESMLSKSDSTAIRQYEPKPGYKIDEYVCENNHEYTDPKTGTQRESFVGGRPRTP